MILATVSTSSFQFAVVDKDRHGCNVALLKAWRRHARQTGADPTLMGEMIGDGDVNYAEVELGQVLRDGTPI